MPGRVVEVGCGPGVGLEALLRLPRCAGSGRRSLVRAAGQAARRNRDALRDGRLRLVQGDTRAVGASAPVALVVAVHVLSFLHEPVRDPSLLAHLLDADGRLAGGLPAENSHSWGVAADFPTAGHRLYDYSDDVRRVVRQARFESDEVRVFGDPTSPGGRLLLATQV